MPTERTSPTDVIQGSTQRQRIAPSRLPARKSVSTSQANPDEITRSSTKLKPVVTRQNGPTKLIKPVPVKKDERKTTVAPRRGIATIPRPEQAGLIQTRSNLPQKTRTPVFEPTRTPSLVSGSSVSTGDSPRSNMLRRRASFGRAGYRASPDNSSPDGNNRPKASKYDDIYSDTVLGISLPPTTQRTLTNKASSDLVINLDHFAPYPILPTDLPLPTPIYAMSAGSSSRLSPGLFSISSTPTTMTCYSPITTTSGPSSSHNQLQTPSPAIRRPSLSRNGTSQSQASVIPTSARQSSSSSGSTIRPAIAYRNGKISLPTSPKPVIENGVRRPVTQKPTSRSQSPTKSARSIQSRQPETYPELAYLKDASPMHSAQRMAPSRPSRDGTPDISFTRASPVIQSNMSSLPIVQHKRHSSNDSRKSIDMKSRFAMARKPSSRDDIPATTPIPTLHAPMNRRMTPEPSSDSEKKSRGQPSPNPEKPQSRFGFFKRSKTEPNLTLSNKEKRLRKGPVAGTGHEGYGKFATRGRSGSNTSGTASIGRSSSADSSKGGNTRPPSTRKGSLGSKEGPVLDDFLVERLQPITLRGTGPIAQSQETDLSGTIQTINKPEDNPKIQQSVSPFAVQSANSSMVASPKPSVNSFASITNSGSPIGNEGKSTRFGLSSLSVRRASRRIALEATIPIKEPERSQEFRFPSHPAINPLERKLSEPTPVVGLDAFSPVTHAPRIETDPTSNARLPKKWNFFQRSRTPVKKTDQELNVPVEVPQQLAPRAVAHYAMMDAPRKIDMLELDQIMQEANDSVDDLQQPEEQVEHTPVPNSKHGNSILLPAPPPFIPDFSFDKRPESPKIMLQTDEKDPVDQAPPSVTYSPPKPRGSRLPQVGRIPRVISRRERERKPSISSFSRPFHPSQPSPALQSMGFPPNGNLITPYREKDSQEVSPVLSTDEAPSSIRPIPDLALPFLPGQPHLSPNDVSSLAEMVSSSPNIGVEQVQWAEDVWDEYDDLLDSFSPTSPRTPKTPKTPHTGSSLGAPFQYAAMSSLPTGSLLSPQFELSATAPSIETLVKSVRFPSMRESQAFLAGSLGTPLSPASIADFLDPEGSRKSTASGRMSLPSTRLSSNSNRYSLPASVRAASLAHKRKNPSVSSVPGISTPSQRKRDSLQIQKSEVRSMGFENMANLRFGALMTSKWLSFGRVLFSPAHHELKSAKEERILVLDGLGKDWSYYVALTYHNSVIYNLSIDPPDTRSSTENSQTGPFGSLPNHRHIHHPGMACPFPFPKGFFTAVVFRFPPVSSESHYRFAIAECKRVLRPGGYLEVSCLDMDMLNMGNLGRRALRGLKENLHAEDPTVSLKPVSDTLQRLIGRRGFENLSRCFVGVPAAGCIPSSREGSGINSGSTSPTKESFVKQSSSFGDMLRDTSPAGEANITQMVSRVARWWYSRCYEADVTSTDGGNNIWTDTALLKECETRGTSLRLMVCFAQKPECVVRRTISV